MKNIRNFIFIGSNNLSKLLKEINQISTIKVTIYKESSKKTFIILPHLASGKQSSGRAIKITITDKEELDELLNGIGIVSRRKMENDLEMINAENNVNQKEVIILKSPPLSGKLFEFLTETQGLFSNESSNLCAAIQRNRFYASDGQIANSMHVLPISQFSRDVLVTGGSSLFPKLTGSDQEAAHSNPKQHKGIKDTTEDNDDHLQKKSLDLKLEKRMSEFETCLSEIFYDTMNKEVVLVEHTKLTKNSKSSPAVVEVHEFRSNDQPRVKKSRVLIVSESRFKKLENSFVKFQAKKKIRNLEPLLTEYDNKIEIMEKLEDKVVGKFRQMQNTYKKKSLIVMNFELPGPLSDQFLVDGSKFENSLMSSKTYIDSLKSFDIVKKRKNRGNLVVVNDQIFKSSTNKMDAQNKNFLTDDSKALVFLNNSIYKELEKKTMFKILNKKYSTGKGKAKKTRKSNSVGATDKKSANKNEKSSKAELSGYSEIPLDNLIAAVAEKKRIEYAARSKIVSDVYEHYEKILENAKILKPPDGNNWKNDMDMKDNSLSKIFRGGARNKMPKIDRPKEVAPRELSTKEVKTDQNIDRNKSECSKVFKGETASSKIILPHDKTKTTPKGIPTKEMTANENIDHNEYDFATIFKGESTNTPSAIDLPNEKSDTAPTDISTKEIKANDNINRNQYNLPKVFKGESAIRTSKIYLPYARTEIVPSEISAKETKDNKTVKRNESDLLEVIKRKSTTKLPTVDLTYEKKETTARKISGKDVKANRNIDQNEHNLSKVIKTKSATRPTSQDKSHEKNQMQPRNVSTKEAKSSRNIDLNKHDLPDVIKTKSATRPTSQDKSYEKNQMPPRNVSTKEAKSIRNIDLNEHDLPEVIKTKSATRPSSQDMSYEKNQMPPRNVSTKEVKSSRNIDQNQVDLPEVIKTKSATRPSSQDMSYEKNQMPPRNVSTKEAKSSRNIDQNEHDLPEVIKTKSATRPTSQDMSYEKNQISPRNISTKEAKSSRNIDQNQDDLPEVIKTKSVSRPPAVNLSHEKKEMIPRKILTKEGKATENIDYNEHDLSKVITGESSTIPPTTDLPYEKKEIAPREISTDEVKASENIGQNELNPSKVIEKELDSRSYAIDLVNGENKIKSIQDSTIEKSDKNIHQNEYDPPKITEVDSPDGEKKMTKGEIKNEEKGDKMNATKIDSQSPILKDDVEYFNLPQQVVGVKSKIPVKALIPPKTNASIVGSEKDNVQQNWSKNDEKFIDSKLKIIRDEHTSKETVKEMTSATAKNIQKVTINVKSSTIKSRLPRLSKPIKHTISKDNNETFLKITKADDSQMKNQEDSLALQKKTVPSKEIEEFIDLKKVMNPNRFFADVHRLIFSEHDEGEMESFSRKIAPNKFQLQFLQNVLSRPDESTYQRIKSNDEDCEAVVKKMVTQIENEETAFHLKIAKREPGTFVIMDPPKNEESLVEPNETVTSKSKNSMDSQKKTSSEICLSEGKERPLQTQTQSHLDKFPVSEKTSDESKGKKIIDEQYLKTQKNSVVSNQNEIDENNNIVIEEKVGSNVSKQVADVEQSGKQVEANAKTNDIKQSEEKQEDTPSKSIPQANSSENHYRGEETSRMAVDLSDNIDKDPRQIAVKSENVSENGTLHVEEKFEAKKKPVTTIMKKISTNAKGILEKTGIGASDYIESKVTLENSGINKEIFKGEKMPRIKVNGKFVNTKEKVKNDDKKKKQKEDNIQLSNNESRLKSKKQNSNEVGQKSDATNRANNITEKFEKFSRNEETIGEFQSEVKNSCETEEKLKLLTIISDCVIKKTETTDKSKESLRKSKPTDQQIVETKLEIKNVTPKTGSECSDGISSKIVEIKDEERKIIIENIEANKTKSEVKRASSFHESDILAENSSSNIGKLKEETEAQNEMKKSEQDTGKGKNNEGFSSDFLNSELNKNSVATEIATDVKQTQFPIEKSDQNIECRLTVVGNEKLDVTEKSLVDKEKLEEFSKKSNDTDKTSGNIDEKKLENRDEIIEIVDKPKDVKPSMKKNTKGKESSVLKCECHNDNIPKDVSKKSVSENVIIIKAAKKDSEETVESVLGITKPFLEQIQSKMLNFVTKKTKSKAKIRNFSFRSHAVKKCKEITALLKHSQEKLFEDNTAGLADICQHAKMINRFSRTKLPPKRLNGATPKTGNTFVTNANDKPKQPQDKKVKKKATRPEELVKSTIETKVASKMKSLAKPPHDGKKPVAIKTIKSPQIPTNQSDVKRSNKLDERNDLLNSSGSITDLGKDSIGSIFAEVVASAMVKCGKVEQSAIQPSDSQEEFANIINMDQDNKQKVGQVEVTRTEKDVEVKNDTMKEIKKPDEFIIEGNDFRKLALNVKFNENTAHNSGDKYKCTISLVLDEKNKEEDVKLLNSETPVVFRPDEQKTSADSTAPFTLEVIQKSEEKRIEIPIEQILMMDDKTKTAVNFQVSPEVDVNVMNNSNAEKTKIDENNAREQLETVIIDKTDKLDVEVKNRIFPFTEKTNRDEQKCILKVDDEIKRHAFEFIHTQTTDAAPKLHFEKISKNDTQQDKNPRENSDNDVTIIKNYQEVVVKIPTQKKIPRDISEISGLLEELDIGISKRNEKGGDGSTVPVPDHLIRFSKGQGENAIHTSKLKSFVGKSEEVNVEIGKIVEFHGLNRQNRNSAMKYLSFSDEYTKTTLDVFPEVFFTPFASKTNVGKEMEVVSEDAEENFGILQNLSNMDQVKTGISKVIHIATNDNTNNNMRKLTYANDIRTSCRVNDFPNSKICREKDKPASKNIQNFEYLKKRIEQDRLKNHGKVTNPKDEMKTEKKSEEMVPNKKKNDEISEDLKQAFAGLEKMGNSIKGKPAQRENVSERSSVRKPIGDYLRNQRRDFATKNPFIYGNDLTQSSTQKLFTKNSNVEAKAKFAQMKVQVPVDAKKESSNKSPEADIKTSQNISRKHSFYHEMVKRSEANKKTIEKEKEIDIVPENSTFCVFNAMKESFDEVCATKKIYLGSRPSMKQYAQMIMADEIKSCNELSHMRNESFSNTNSNEKNPKMDILQNKDPKLPTSEICLYNLQTTKHNRPQTSGSFGLSDGNKRNGNIRTRESILNTQDYFDIEASKERNFKPFDVTAILEKKQKPDSISGAVQYEPLVIEDLHITIDENSESRKDDDFSFKPKISQIPIRTSDVMPKHNVLEKFAAIDRVPGSPVYKIRGDLTYDSSTKRIHKNVNVPQEKQKPRPQVTNAKSKGVAVQENATRRQSTSKPKSKKMVVKLTPSKQLYSPPQKNNHDDLKRTLLKNPSKLLEIAGEVMDKNQYLNFLLDLKSRKEIRNFWWKKIYEGILSSLKLTEPFTTKAKRSEKSNIKVKSSFPSDDSKTKSKKAMKVVKKQSFNLESLFIAPKKERKKEKIIVVKEKPASPNLTKRLTIKSLRATPNSEVKPKIISTETDTDNMRAKSANSKSPRGNQMLKSETNQDSTNRRNLSSQHRESVNSKINSLPYTLKKYLETPDLMPKKSSAKSIENKRAVENFQNVFVLGEELKMPKLNYTVACLGMPNEFEKFNRTQIVEGRQIENQSQKNLKDIVSSQLMSKSTNLKNVETTSMLEEECFKEIQLQAEEYMKISSDYKKEDTTKRCDGLNQGSNTEIEIAKDVDNKTLMISTQLSVTNNEVVKTQSDKDLVFPIPEHLITDESIVDCNDNSVELSAPPSSEKPFLKANNNTNEVKESNLNMNASENSHVHLHKEDINILAKEAPGSIASSIRDSSDLDNYFDVLSFPISSTRSETDECRIRMMETSEFDDSSDVFSNRSAPVSSACSAAREHKNAPKRAASITSSKGETLHRNASFDDMRKSNEKLMIGAKPTGNMNFQTRRKFENPLSKFVSKKKIPHSGHVSNVQHSQESIADTHVENTAKVRVIRTKSLSEILKDDPYFLTRLREQKKTPSYATPRRVEEVPRKFEYRYHDFRRKYDVGGKTPAKSQLRKKDFFEKFRDLIQTKRPFGDDNQRAQGEEAEQMRPKVATKFNEKVRCVEDDKTAESEKSDKADSAATDRNTNSTRNFCNSLLLKSKFGSWRFVHTKMEHIDEDELMTWVQEHPHTPTSRSRTDNSKGDENDKQNVIHVPWISSSANDKEDN